MTQLTFSVPFYCCIPVRFPSESLDSRFAAECQSRLQFCSGSVQCRYKVRRYRILGFAETVWNGVGDRGVDTKRRGNWRSEDTWEGSFGRRDWP